MQYTVYTPEFLLELRNNPPQLGKLANERRGLFFARNCQLRVRPPKSTGHSIAHCNRLGKLHYQDHWPTEMDLNIGDAWSIAVEPTQCIEWVQWLSTIAKLVRVAISVSPHSDSPSATHRLWLLASARLLLPEQFRIEVRHDLLGIHIAQIGLNFGADTLSGPIDEERSLPLAGVSRPVETSKSALSLLIEQAGYQPCSYDDPKNEREPT